MFTGTAPDLKAWKCLPTPTRTLPSQLTTFSAPPPRSPREEVAPSVTTYIQYFNPFPDIITTKDTASHFQPSPDLELLWSYVWPARPPQKERTQVLLRLNGFAALKLCVLHPFRELSAAVVVEGSSTVEGLIAWDSESQVWLCCGLIL